MTSLCFFHPSIEINVPPFDNDFHPKTKVFKNQDAFIFTLARSPHFSSNGPSDMVYELLQYYFVPNDFVNGLG
jgi:hypothetical protein